jgi:hypothetical protein
MESNRLFLPVNSSNHCGPTARLAGLSKEKYCTIVEIANGFRNRNPNYRRPITAYPAIANTSRNAPCTRTSNLGVVPVAVTSGKYRWNTR